MCSQKSVLIECDVLQRFMKRWIDDDMHNEPVRTSPLPIELYREYGTIDCLLQSDPKQVVYDGRWTFDPRNRNYEKAFHLAWPTLCGERNRNTLGNILESLLGVRNARVKYGKKRDLAIESVCGRVSNFVNAVYQFTQWTDSEYDDIIAWTAYVRGLSLAQ